MKIENNPPNEFSNYRLLSVQALRLALAALRRKQIIIKYNQIEYPIEMPADDRIGSYILSKPDLPTEFSKSRLPYINQKNRFKIASRQIFAY